MLNLTSGSSTDLGAALVTHLAHHGRATNIPVPTSDAISDIRSELAIDSDDDDEDMLRTRRELAQSFAIAERAASELRSAKQRKKKGTSVASHDSDRSRTRHDPIQDLGLSAALSMEMERQGIQQAHQAREVLNLVSLQQPQPSAPSFDPSMMQQAFNQEMHMANMAMRQKDINEAHAVENIRMKASEALNWQMNQAEQAHNVAINLAEQQTADKFRQETADYLRRETAIASQQRQQAEARVVFQAQEREAQAMSVHRQAEQQAMQWQATALRTQLVQQEEAMNSRVSHVIREATLFRQQVVDEAKSEQSDQQRVMTDKIISMNQGYEQQIAMMKHEFNNLLLQQQAALEQQ
jgi:hypothetical protein